METDKTTSWISSAYKPSAPCRFQEGDLVVGGERGAQMTGVAMSEKIRLHNIEGIARLSGTDENDCQWIQFKIDPMAGECDCEGPECNPETCPRFVTECSVCGALVSAGWMCLDGGDEVCEDCAEYKWTRS